MRIGPYRVDPPVVLAPMAGITNVAFRRLCRQFLPGRQVVPRGLGGAGQPAGGLLVCEMITSRALVERHPGTLHMISFDAAERPRSMQLYGVDPATVRKAVELVRDEDLADHIDLNFGCPVPKVTRRGGGAALPFKRALFDEIVRGAVQAAAHIPVTVKFRIGIDAEHHTFLDAGRIAEDAGVAAVALHARTAAQRYSGSADWDAVAALKQAVRSIPVLGNGDIFAAADALRMVERTGCDGVVVGRGCLGRPWLFAELTAAFGGAAAPTPPTLGRVAVILRRHAELLTAHLGTDKGLRDLRKHISWYLHGFPVGGDLRRALGMVSSLAELDDLLAQLDRHAPFPSGADGPRGRQGSPGRVVLPEGWLDDPMDLAVPAGAELADSGG
ncbi:MAG TPA: tRNA dihydrouridine synthase DusB [Pseudonocardiaceae bacterium]|jgi:nifR3 family TIM-barrel protein|nr:tRNA dihydrouridine synthase DusB [Pseudonocardiaceae bacterium]